MPVLLLDQPNRRRELFQCTEQAVEHIRSIHEMPTANWLAFLNEVIPYTDPTLPNTRFDSQQYSGENTAEIPGSTAYQQVIW